MYESEKGLDAPPPLEGLPRTRPSGRTPARVVITMSVVLVLAGMVVIAVTAGGDDPTPGRPTGPNAAASPRGGALAGQSDTAGNAARSGPGRQYKPITQPCGVAQWGPLETAVGGSVTKTREQARQRETFATMSCEADLDRRGEAGLAIMLIDIFPGGSAEPMFTGLRGVQSAATPVAGLGEGAYWFVDPDLGPRVVAYDGNMQVSVGWSLLNGDADLPTDTVIAALTAVCQQTMTRLQG